MYKQRIKLFFLISFLLFALSFFFILLFAKYPLYTQAEYWLKDAITIKNEYNKQIRSPKIIVISGSNSLFGICSSLLQEKTRYNVLNLGLHASLPLEFLIILAKKYAEPNDIVLMPLEFSYYCSEKIFNRWQIENLTTWGIEYLKDFNLLDRTQIILKAMSTYYNRLKKCTFKLPIKTYDEYVKNKNMSALLSDKYDYGNSINFYGEILMDQKSKLPQTVTYSYINLEHIKNFRFNELKLLADTLKKQNIQLLFTFPVMFNNSQFNLSKKENAISIEKFKKKFAEFHLPLIGNPKLLTLDLPYSYDTAYHANAEGAILRTLYLADAINAYLLGKENSIANITTYKKEKEKEAYTILEKYRLKGYIF